MSEKKISQIGATKNGSIFLRKLAGRQRESGAKRDKEFGHLAPFTEIKDAYRALFIYGLIKGGRKTPGDGESFSTIYANVNMLSGDYGFKHLLIAFGNPSDLDDIGKSINEYTNWSIEQLRFDYDPLTFKITEGFTDEGETTVSIRRY